VTVQDGQPVGGGQVQGVRRQDFEEWPARVAAANGSRGRDDRRNRSLRSRACDSRLSAPSSPARRFADLRWRTRDSWSRKRRVVAKAEWMPGRGERGANPRLNVTSLPATEIGARALYERVYFGRGEMENRIKVCQLDLFADRTSAANQLRLWFGSMACVLMAARAASHWPTPPLSAPPAAASGSGFSRLAPKLLEAGAASSSPWPELAMPASWHSPMPDYAEDPAKSARKHLPSMRKTITLKTARDNGGAQDCNSVGLVTIRTP
jgi:hypothetical protein